MPLCGADLIRAGLAEKIGDWRWSSALIRKHYSSEQQKILSAWPVEFPKYYEKWANIYTKDEDVKLEKIRHALKRGYPFGESNWVTNITQKLGLESTFRNIGRPRKGA